MTTGRINQVSHCKGLPQKIQQTWSNEFSVCLCSKFTFTQRTNSKSRLHITPQFHAIMHRKRPGHSATLMDWSVEYASINNPVKELSRGTQHTHLATFLQRRTTPPAKPTSKITILEWTVISCAAHRLLHCHGNTADRSIHKNFVFETPTQTPKLARTIQTREP